MCRLFLTALDLSILNYIDPGLSTLGNSPVVDVEVTSTPEDFSTDNNVGHTPVITHLYRVTSSTEFLLYTVSVSLCPVSKVIPVDRATVSRVLRYESNITWVRILGVDLVSVATDIDVGNIVVWTSWQSFGTSVKPYHYFISMVCATVATNNTG